MIFPNLQIIVVFRRVTEVMEYIRLYELFFLLTDFQILV